MLFGLLVDCSDFGVEDFFLFVFCGVVRCSVYVIVSVLPNRDTEIPEVSHKGWSDVCCDVFVVEVSEGVILVVCLKPRRGGATAE